MSNHSGTTKQTKETARLAKRIRDKRDRGVKWDKICLELGILKDTGLPDTGLAYRIAFDDYEPKGPDLRDRLGLRKICLACLRGFRQVSSSVRELSPWRLWWRKLDPSDRDRRIRSEYEKENR